MNNEIGRLNIIIYFGNKDRAFSFLGIHKSEPDINIGFSPALHLQCTVTVNDNCLSQLHCEELAKCKFVTLSDFATQEPSCHGDSN
jgi:hypothetical protein